MNKDCASVRKVLPKYLRGHVFKYQQIRIARHLKGCPVCRSEFQALERIADTHRLLRDVNEPEGTMQRLKGKTRSLGRLSILFYRPLWLLAIAGAAVLVYLNLVAPRQHDIEIENIEKTLPPPSMASAPVATRDAVPPAPAAAPLPPPVPKPEKATALAPAAALDPLVVIITPLNEKTPGQVNEMLRGYSQFKKKRFSESVHEISGALAGDDFLEFFSKIEQAGKVSYSRKKYASYPSSQPIPFVMKMKPVPRPPEPVSSAQSPAEAGADAQSAPLASDSTQSTP